MAWISPNVTGPAMGVLVTPVGGVAQATFKATPPKAPATKTPANISFHLILLMVMLLRGVRGEVPHRGGPQRCGCHRRCWLWPSERRTAPYLSCDPLKTAGRLIPRLRPSAPWPG